MLKAVRIVRYVNHSIFLLIFLCLKTQFAYSVEGLPFPDAPCPEGSEAVRETNGFCVLDYDASAPAWWGGGAHFKSGGIIGISYVSFDYSYVPYSGDFKLAAYICNEKGLCSRKNSVNSVSTGSEALHVNEIIAKQVPVFPPGEDKTIPSPFSMCMALTGKYGDVWRPADSDPLLFCSDAQPLPVEPSECIFNPAGTLDINFGVVERENIKTEADLEQIKKAVPVVCSGESKLDTLVTFDFSPISINGGEVVPVSTKGLGVKLFYNGKPVTKQDQINLALMPGENEFTLGFTLIRDKARSLGEIVTGDFNASVILISTVQ